MTPTQPSQAVEAAVRRFMKLADMMAGYEADATLLADESAPRSAGYVEADKKYLTARQELEAALSAELARPHEVAAVGDWLWSQLMDYCKKRGTHPGENNDLFAIVSRARERFATPAPKQGDAKDARPDSFHSDSGDRDRVQAPGPTDAERLDWLDQNIFHRELDDEWDRRLHPGKSMWVMFTNSSAQGSSRNIIDAAILASKAAGDGE